MTEQPLNITRVQLRQHMNILVKMAEDWFLAAEAAAKVLEAIQTTPQSPNIQRMRARAEACRFAARMMEASLKGGKG
jgi:hypothetical protein